MEKFFMSLIVKKKQDKKICSQKLLKNNMNLKKEKNKEKKKLK
jgi:hypothetical protein